VNAAGMVNDVLRMTTRKQLPFYCLKRSIKINIEKNKRIHHSTFKSTP